MPAQDLSEDVALLILEACDIATVSSMGQVNVFLHRLTLSKQLWIILVEDLIARFLIDAPRTRSLAELSLDELVGLVKRTVVGPATWSPSTSPSVADQISLPANGIAENIELLPGGRHLFVQSHRRIELWNVERTAPLWSRGCEWDTGYAFDMVEGGRAVVILRELTPASESLLVTQVHLEVGLESQELLDMESRAEDLFELRLPAHCTVRSVKPAICGDLLVQAVRYQVHSTVHALLLVNWRLQKYVLIQCSESTMPLIFFPDLAIVPGHLIFTMAQSVVVFAVADLAPHWRGITSLADENFSEFPTANVAPFITAPLQLPSSSGRMTRVWNPTMAVYRSPLRHHGYKLLVYHSGDIARLPEAAIHALLTFNFTILPDTEAIEGWNLVSSVPAIRIAPYVLPTSYAGYAVRWDTQRSAFAVVNVRSFHSEWEPDDPLGCGTHAAFDFAEGSSIGLSPYNHARLQIVESRTIVVTYYL